MYSSRPAIVALFLLVSRVLSSEVDILYDMWYDTITPFGLEGCVQDRCSAVELMTRISTIRGVCWGTAGKIIIIYQNKDDECLGKYNLPDSSVTAEREFPAALSPADVLAVMKQV